MVLDEVDGAVEDVLVEALQLRLDQRLRLGVDQIDLVALLGAAIAKVFEEQQRKEMKAIFNFAAANRDAASLRASTLTTGRSEKQTLSPETKYGF